MKKTLLVVSFAFVSCYQAERKCADFKTGTFEFTQQIEGKKLTSTFVRNDSIQIETFNGKTDTARVRWVNDCEYIIQKIHPKNLQEKKAINIKILTTNTKGYTFEYSFLNDAKKQQGAVTKID